MGDSSQTPLKNRLKPSDLTNRKSHLKKPQKIPKKSLNDVLFTSVSDNITPPPSDSSPISQITVVSASSETFPLFDSTPITAEPNDDVVSILKQARTEVTDFADVEFKSKKLLDALIEVVINEYTSCPGEKEMRTERVWIRICVVAVWCVAVLGILFFNRGFNNYSYNGPLPT